MSEITSGADDVISCTQNVSVTSAVQGGDVVASGVILPRLKAQ